MEPKWNVKYIVKIDVRKFFYCINGTKVECKGTQIIYNSLEIICINGTKVECKGYWQKFARC